MIRYLKALFRGQTHFRAAPPRHFVFDYVRQDMGGGWEIHHLHFGFGVLITWHYAR